VGSAEGAAAALHCLPARPPTTARLGWLQAGRRAAARPLEARAASAPRAARAPTRALRRRRRQQLLLLPPLSSPASPPLAPVRARWRWIWVAARPRGGGWWRRPQRRPPAMRAEGGVCGGAGRRGGSGCSAGPSPTQRATLVRAAMEVEAEEGAAALARRTNLDVPHKPYRGPPALPRPRRRSVSTPPARPTLSFLSDEATGSAAGEAAAEALAEAAVDAVYGVRGALPWRRDARGVRAGASTDNGITAADARGPGLECPGCFESFYEEFDGEPRAEACAADGAMPRQIRCAVHSHPTLPQARRPSAGPIRCCETAVCECRL